MAFNLKINNYIKGKTHIEELEISSGEVIAILGGYSSGKTNILNIIGEQGFDNGLKVHKFNPALFTQVMNPYETLRNIGINEAKMTAKQANGIIDLCAKEFNSNANCYRDVGISYSECLKLELINVILINPDILLIDDISYFRTTEGIALMNRFLKLFNNAIIYTSIDPNVADILSTRSLFVSKLNITEDTKIATLVDIKQYINEDVKKFLESAPSYS